MIFKSEYNNGLPHEYVNEVAAEPREQQSILVLELSSPKILKRNMIYQMLPWTRAHGFTKSQVTYRKYWNTNLWTLLSMIVLHLYVADWRWCVYISIQHDLTFQLLDLKLYTKFNATLINGMQSLRKMLFWIVRYMLIQEVKDESTAKLHPKYTLQNNLVEITQ